MGVSVDIQKAFNKVNRGLLWAKLENWGAVGPLMDIVKLMYADPRLTLKMNACFSDFIDSTVGVLQGCPLSRLLFITYLADVPLTSWYDPTLNGTRVSGLMLADNLLLLSTSSVGAENKLAILHRYLYAHGMTLNPSKSWALNLTLDRGVDPAVVCNGQAIPMASAKMYNGWKLVANVRGGAWQTNEHLMMRYNNSLSVAQSLMSLTKSLNVPTSSLSLVLYRLLIEPELIYACESSFDCPLNMNMLYNRLQLKFLRFCLGLPSYSVGQLVLWDCGQLALSSRRLQLTSRFFAHISSLPRSRLSFHAIRDSVQLGIVGRRGWHFSFVSKLGAMGVVVPVL